jgi:methionyl-tRNA formyltransferase
MDIVFCGTPEFAVPSLQRLLESGFRVKLVVTQPDRPRGRGMELAVGPVKSFALAHGLEVAQPATIKNNSDFQQQLAALHPEAIVVVGYGRIIPQWMRELPRLGNINLHASLLPKYRGAAPIQWAIAQGETITGNTTMRIDAGLDTGDILMQEQIPIDPADTAVTLAPRLARHGANLLVTTLQKLQQGTILSKPQDNSSATLAPILRREDGRLDFSRSAMEILNRLRGFQPWPGAFTLFRGKKLEITAARVVGPEKSKGGPAPRELRFADGMLLVGAGKESALEILEVQPEGKKRLSARDFANGSRIQPGEKFGDTNSSGLQG